ncbi:Fic family protein [Pseudorhodobacter sp.]|uniref:Fic family protein n=1 Tax=Pseudorhodobacter sp. TaxID=1934400 RepID=UPI0026496880|nr:Fic family protein [Pseudorhodobacter sp.]MDN5786365.1 Fic family protein [Pseudorhodobacter sp.]
MAISRHPRFVSNRSMLRDSGSAEPVPAKPTQITLAATAAERALLEQRCDTAETRFRSAVPEQLRHLALHPTATHCYLFHGLCPSMPEAVGGFRGTPGTRLQNARRVVLVKGTADGLRRADPCDAPDRVAAQMELLQQDMQIFWNTQRQPDCLPALADMTFRFFRIHPFLDGNGHVWRLILIALARRAGLRVSADWTVHARPYGPEFSLALQMFSTRPDLLASQLSGFATPDPDNSR